MNYDGSHWTHSETVAAGGTSILKLAVSRPVVVTASPQSTGTATVEFTAAPIEDIDAGIATWRPLLTLAAGTAGDAAKDYGVRALRFKAMTAACRFEASQ